MASSAGTQIDERGNWKEPNPQITVERLKEDFDAKMAVWQQSSARQQLLASLTRPEAGWQIKKVVCLALGRLSSRCPSSNERSMRQLVCAVDFTWQLRAAGEEATEFYAQDPKFFDIDKDFLSRNGIQVLECPRTRKGGIKDGLNEAKQHLGANTLVFEFFVYKSARTVRELFESDCKLWCMCGSHSVLVGQSFMGNRHDPSLSSLAAPFAENHWEIEFPSFREAPFVFKGLRFYGKKDPNAMKRFTGLGLMG